MTLELSDLEGTPRSLADYRGSIVILNFWATWCLPCRDEMPIFVRLQEEYGERGAQVIAASADEDPRRESVHRFGAEFGLEFPIWMGATTRDMERFDLGVTLPATAILDRDGGIVWRVRGVVDEQELREQVEWLLGERTQPPPSESPVAASPGIPSRHQHVEAPGDRSEKAHRHGAEEEGHGHADEGKHAHGSVAVEGGSLVPS